MTPGVDDAGCSMTPDVDDAACAMTLGADDAGAPSRRLQTMRLDGHGRALGRL